MNEDNKDSVPGRPAGPRTFRLIGLVVLAAMIIVLGIFYGTAPREAPPQQDGSDTPAAETSEL